MRVASWDRAVVLSLFVVGLAWAEPPDNPHVWDPEVRSVAVFKNGMGFLIREGDVQLRDGWCVTGAVPPALFGTLAIYALDESYSVDVVGAGTGQVIDFDGKDGPADVEGKVTCLESYKGLNVELTHKDGDAERRTAGRLTDVTGDFAILKREGSLAATPLSELTKLHVLDYPLRVHVDGAPPNGTVRLGMAYLRKGVTWIPEYSLRVVDETKAELTLRATFVNEVENLVRADIHFVVGVPSFIHADYLTPIAIGQAIRSVASSLPVQFQGQMMSNAIMTRSAVAQDARAGRPETEVREVPPADGDIDRVLQNLPRMGGAGATDYTVYTKPGMTVRQREKAIVTVFDREIRYGHMYRWHSPGALRHYLVLHNDTDTAWTTGPVIAVSDRRPLCQDTICYTPRGSRYELPVTTAVNIASAVVESEMDRKLKAHEPANHFFLDLVTIEGRLTVRNHEQSPVELSIEREVPGLLISTSNDGQTRQDIDKLKLIERRGWASWTLTLAPGERKELTYRYERYVPSR